LSDELCRTEADGVRKVEEFHHVDPSFTPFDPRNVRLLAIQPVSERRLSQARIFPRLRQQSS
jgi:hypothetical protein